jgi:bacillopeptidase F (M6 metalloprotease family)
MWKPFQKAADEDEHIHIHSHVRLTETRQKTYEAAFGNRIHSTQAAYWKNPPVLLQQSQ